MWKDHPRALAGLPVFSRSSWGGIQGGESFDHQKLCMPSSQKWPRPPRSPLCLGYYYPGALIYLGSPTVQISLCGWQHKSAAAIHLAESYFLEPHQKNFEAIIVFQVTQTSLIREAGYWDHLRNSTAWIGIPALPLPMCVTGDRLLLCIKVNLRHPCLKPVGSDVLWNPEYFRF